MSNENSLKITITGAHGRMGRALLETTVDDPELQLVGALEREEHDGLGLDVSTLIDGKTDVTISDDPSSVFEQTDVVVDFTHPDATEQFLERARETNTSMVIGTTGLDDEQTRRLESTAGDVPIVKAPNMSVGINLLANLVAEATETLGEDFDAEILEMHHRHKEDAPSGTANMLAETIADVRDLDLENVREDGRKGFVGERSSDEIGIAALRGGDVVGDHTVILAGEGERLELTHKASSRETFARGALRAAKFLENQEPGLYSMKDVLGL
jgi:4-hydroxy-tetrahydrodipicolinate reductase